MIYHDRMIDNDCKWFIIIANIFLMVDRVLATIRNKSYWWVYPEMIAGLTCLVLKAMMLWPLHLGSDYFALWCRGLRRYTNRILHSQRTDG